ncbi:MAG: hypothetical protein IPI62_08980 [Bacteroidetes bacterium]|nr:hypothetical protein [Bacteroidota bacterium]
MVFIKEIVMLIVTEGLFRPIQTTTLQPFYIPASAFYITRRQKKNSIFKFTDRFAIHFCNYIKMISCFSIVNFIEGIYNCIAIGCFKLKIELV